MRPTSIRQPAAVVAGVLAAPVLALAPAHAALACAPDAHEKDTAATGAPLTVGGTTTRAICQEPTPQPRTETPRDEDFSTFTASGDKAYTVQAVNVGAALVNDEYGYGGLELKLFRLNADGTTADVAQDRDWNGDRVVTGVLPAGRYVVLAHTLEYQIYPETNTMDIKTVQGAAGVYGIRLTAGAAAEAAPAAPAVTSLTLSQSSVDGGRSVTGTYTLSAPAPAGGMVVDVRSSHEQVASAGSAYAPAGATRVSFGIATEEPSRDLRVTLTASTSVGSSRSAVLTVRD